jgi:hypothetical protein
LVNQVPAFAFRAKSLFLHGAGPNHKIWRMAAKGRGVRAVVLDIEGTTTPMSVMVKAYLSLADPSLVPLLPMSCSLTSGESSPLTSPLTATTPNFKRT